MEKSTVQIKVVGIGGAGGNAVLRMANNSIQGLELLAINTDVQALQGIKHVPTFAIGPTITEGMGSGGNADLGRKAINESHDQVSQLLENSDLVFITAGMGGGTGTGAASVIADIAKKHGALTIAIVTRPFLFEGDHRQKVSARGLKQLNSKVDTLITIDNERLLPAINGKLSIEKAFTLADQVLRQGVLGISEIISVPGLINVDFADIKTIITKGGRSFMATGQGKGKSAAANAVQAALSNPLFDTPLEGAKGILLNIKGGKDLTLSQVHEAAKIVSEASNSRTQIIFGVVQDKKWHKRVHITLVATGLTSNKNTGCKTVPTVKSGIRLDSEPPTIAKSHSLNGHRELSIPGAQKFI